MLGISLASAATKRKIIDPLLYSDGINSDVIHQSTPQTTLKTVASCRGVGVHSGQPVSLTIRPAAANTGYVFIRTDVASEHQRIVARWDTVVDTTMCTKVANEHGVSVSTIEHLMAALAGCQIHNAVIEIDGPEVPIMDGSSSDFVDMFEEAGKQTFQSPLPTIRVLKPIHVIVGKSTACFLPSREPMMVMKFDMNGRLKGKSWTLSFDPDHDDFSVLLSDARTFGFYEDAQRLLANGLARGASLNNTIVLKEGGEVMNEDGLRHPDEFIRHKMLDAIGDFALSQGRILARFEGTNSGHATNNQLLRALFADTTAWEII